MSNNLLKNSLENSKWRLCCDKDWTINDKK